jgi:hypothetical protein
VGENFGGKLCSWDVRPGRNWRSLGKCSRGISGGGQRGAWRGPRGGRKRRSGHAGKAKKWPTMEGTDAKAKFANWHRYLAYIVAALNRLAPFKYLYSRNMRFLIYDLSSIYLIFVLALTLTTQDAYDESNKSSKLLSTIIFRRFIKLTINASLYEGPIFYFYVESSPSIFMHHLRKYSYHSEYNVHSPKIYY